METRPSRTLSVRIARSSDEVYRFVSNPKNMPAWARGLCRAITRTPDGWIAETQDGPVEVRFAPANDLGVLDHHVKLRSGEEIFGPMRVIPNGEGSELMFTLFRLPRMSDAEFVRDTGLVERDLLTLKDLLERT